MKRLAILLLLTAALAAAPADAQTIKSLGYNTTNGHVVYLGTNVLTFTNALSFSTNAAATTRTNLGLGATGSPVFQDLDVVGQGRFGKAISPSLAIGGGEEAFLHIITEQQGEIQIGWGPDDSEFTELALTLEQTDWKFYKPFSVPDATNRAIIRTNLSLGLPALTNTSNVTTMRALAGSTNTNQPFSGSISLTNTNTLVFSNGILLSQ